ncbi:hypothetical protein TNCV_2282461 [Trichonephila clavipes]|nr:hypothetical protein TNCV_2282461 [Trichonephila clavipes]
MPDDHIIFQWLHRQLLETRWFQVTKHDAGRRRAVHSPSLVESILNAVADRHESNRRSIAHYVIVLVTCIQILRLMIDKDDSGRMTAVQRQSQWTSDYCCPFDCCRSEDKIISGRHNTPCSGCGLKANQILP